MGGAAAAPPAHLAMVCSVWGTTLSSLRSELSSTASCGSTVRRACPTAATVAFHFHRLGDLSTDHSSQLAEWPLQDAAAGYTHLLATTYSRCECSCLRTCHRWRTWESCVGARRAVHGHCISARLHEPAQARAWTCSKTGS